MANRPIIRIAKLTEYPAQDDSVGLEVNFFFKDSDEAHPGVVVRSDEGMNWTLIKLENGQFVFGSEGTWTQR